MLQVNFSPFPELRTARLQLRKLDIHDADTLFFLRSDPRVLKYLERPPLETKAEAAEFINKILLQLKENEGIMWVICFKDEPGKMIGTIGYWKLIPEHYRAEIGYLLHPDHWNKGIMKEALQKVTDYGFRKLCFHTIEANIHPGNASSAFLLQSCGFQQEGYFRDSFYYNGKFSDTAVYSLINTL